MSDGAPRTALLLRGVSKRYRVYRQPSYRLLDLFGLCPDDPKYFKEVTALEGVDLAIERGEKIAIIGRNGAGKSTLLKLVTGVVEPSTGAVTVTGRLSPLLQIGAGFHAEFTGRQNVYSSLAHLGIVGREAAAKFEEIVDFAELESFIDQPMKTYSTGMAARLMFSAATSVDPDILVIDELLGVGDAYFAQKSFDRMRQMCQRAGTTLLLVTHDLYAALNLCERFVWIDHGRVQRDGNGRDTVGAYEASIKSQEEERLRRRHTLALDGTRHLTGLRVMVRSRSGFALDRPLALSRLSLRYSNATTVTLDVATGHPSWVLLPEGNLGAPAPVAGRNCRQLSPYGSIYHKAEWTVAIPEASGFSTFEVDWLYEGSAAAELLVTGDDGTVLVKAELGAAEGWQTASLPVDVAGSRAEAGEGGHYGSGGIRMVSVRWRGYNGTDTAEIPHGGRVTAEIDYRVVDPSVSRDITLIVVFNRAGSTASGYVARQQLTLPGSAGRLSVTMDPVLLGSGTWLATIAIGKAALFSEAFIPYFTVNPAWHHFVARGWELNVVKTTDFDPWAFVMLPADVRADATDLS